MFNKRRESFREIQEYFQITCTDDAFIVNYVFFTK